MLPFDAWNRRHRWILKILWVHAVGLGLASLAVGNSVVHSLFEGGIVAACALTAMFWRADRRTSTLIAAVGLLTSSALLVHLFNGRVEMHFSYFVMVGVVTLYQDWLPLLVAIGYVVLQHGLASVVDPSMVFDHQAGIEHPWTWAAVHGGFILAMSAVGLVSWRMNETFQAQIIHREARLAEAQHLAKLGSWDVDVTTGTVEWSDELGRLMGLDTINADARHRGVAVVRRARRPPGAGTRSERIASRRRRRTPETSGCGQRAANSAGCTAPPTSPVRVDGRITVISGTVQDVTERKLAETELAETLSQLSATLDSTADGILVVSTSGVITNLNERFRHLFSLPDTISVPLAHEEVLAIILPQLKDPDIFIRRIEDVHENPDSRSEDVVELRDGRTFERRYMPQRVDGRIVGRVWSLRDVTERIQLEVALVPPGIPRFAHRPRQQGALHGSTRSRARPRPNATRVVWPCCSSISTSSRR